jgi:hypothetical protein
MTTNSQKTSDLSRAVISTWIVLDSPEEETEFPSAGTHSSSRAFQWIYWRCIVVFFATSIKQNPGAHHVLFCNRPFETIPEQETLQLLREWNVELISFPLTYRLPKGAVSKFGNVFYELDILKYAAKQDWPALLILDNDCVWVKPFTPVIEQLRDRPLVGYTLKPEDQKNYQGDVLTNGMSRKRMKAIVQELGGSVVSGDVNLFGGEFFAATKEGIRTLVSYFDRLWDKTVSESRAVDSIKTEEHFFTILFEIEHAQPFAANSYIRRLWTHFEDFNVLPSDLNLAIWHVPAEKHFGFKTLYSEIMRSPSRFFNLPNEQAVQLIRNHMGIPRRSKVKLVRDVSVKVLQRIRSKIAALSLRLAPSRQTESLP